MEFLHPLPCHRHLRVTASFKKLCGIQSSIFTCQYVISLAKNNFFKQKSKLLSSHFHFSYWYYPFACRKHWWKMLACTSSSQHLDLASHHPRLYIVATGKETIAGLGVKISIQSKYRFRSSPNSKFSCLSEVPLLPHPVISFLVCSVKYEVHLIDMILKSHDMLEVLNQLH